MNHQRDVILRGGPRDGVVLAVKAGNAVWIPLLDRPGNQHARYVSAFTKSGEYEVFDFVEVTGANGPGHVPPRPMPAPAPPAPAPAPTEPFPPNTLFRVRRSWFGRCILQKFDGNLIEGPPPGFRDVLWSRDLGGFTIVRREALAKLVDRVAAAEDRARKQREQRKAKKDFEASRLEQDGDDR